MNDVKILTSVGTIAVLGDEILQRRMTRQAHIVLARNSLLVVPDDAVHMGQSHVVVDMYSRSGQRIREAPRVPREQARIPQVAQLQEQHDESLEPDASARVRGHAPPEGVGVVLHLGGVDAGGFDALLDLLRRVETLAAGEDLLATQEDVEGVGQFRVLGIGHRVEGAHFGGELVCTRKVLAVRQTEE